MFASPEAPESPDVMAERAILSLPIMVRSIPPGNRAVVRLLKTLRIAKSGNSPTSTEPIPTRADGRTAAVASD